MDLAKHGPSGVTYLAIEFQRLDPVERERLREQLVCTGCEAAAYYVPPTKRGTCYFGARPHNVGCTLAAPEGAHSPSSLPEAEQRAIASGTWRLRPHRPQGRSQHHLEQDPDAAPHEGKGRRYTQAPGARRSTPSVGFLSLLTKLEEDPAFASSTDTIELPSGRGTARVRSYCVNVVDVTEELVNRRKLYWGTIYKPGEVWDGGRWLYTQWGSPNVLLSADMLQLVMEDNDMDSVEEFSGASFLHLGYLNRSREGGTTYFKPKEPEWFAVRLDPDRN